MLHPIKALLGRLYEFLEFFRTVRSVVSGFFRHQDLDRRLTLVEAKLRRGRGR